MTERFAIVPADVRQRRRELTPNAYALYIELCAFRNAETGQCNPSKAAQIEASYLSETQWYVARANLAEKGWIRLPEVDGGQIELLVGQFPIPGKREINNLRTNSRFPENGKSITCEPIPDSRNPGNSRFPETGNANRKNRELLPEQRNPRSDARAREEAPDALADAEVLALRDEIETLIREKTNTTQVRTEAIAKRTATEVATLWQSRASPADWRALPDACRAFNREYRRSPSLGHYALDLLAWEANQAKQQGGSNATRDTRQSKPTAVERHEQVLKERDSVYDSIREAQAARRGEDSGRAG